MDEFVFINNCTDRADATVLFASILRSIYDHPNWSQLYDFFTKRYASDQTLLDLEARKLSAPAGSSQGPEKHKTVHFKTDPSSVGLPRDLPAHLAEGCRGARGNIVNSDPLPCAIGPAISVAMGPGAYMDLTYMGQPPGKYPAHDPATVKPNECDDGDSAREVASAIPSANMGGRGRSWAEWADLWRVIAEWVYEYDATSLQLNFWDGLFGYKRVLNDQERLSVSSGARVPRDCLSTHALDAADAIRDIFSQLDARPTDFQGLEWDYLEIEVPPRLRWAFYQRFGHKDADHKKNLEALVRRFPQNELDRLDYSDVKPTALKPCPDSFRGIDWEAWMLSIEGGNVVVIKTLFQALWAVMLLDQLPLQIKILEKGSKAPKLRYPYDVYL
ncbi:hypothetical protein C7999DRAFT_40568 [Corynascus novoguineensis]|uniref:Uncharacterized protein n=1 Tax=Corynascus novoguineensis TaxID=1126955 RepID=A0AAN7CUQ9_9PEZI|nr:hypothetical protein C7999DRAFT_40568 [Corynascus novoguineensis]